MSNKEIRLPDGLDVETATDVLGEYARTDDAQIVDKDTLEGFKEELKAAKEAFAAVLAEESPQSADTLARQDMDALTEPFRDDEGSIDVDTLRQNPETGSGNGAGDGGDNGGNGTGNGFDVDALDHSTIEEIRTIDLPKKTAFENRGMDKRVDTLEAEIAEKVGAESFEDVAAELEVL